MTNILTVQQAANALRVETTDLRMLDLLPQVDEFIKRATGRDWTQDTLVNPIAVSAATILLVQGYDNPAMLGSEDSLRFGLSAALIQLEAEALKYRGVLFFGRNGAGGIALSAAHLGDAVVKLVGVYGVSGSQTASFETIISVEGQIQQVSSSDLSANSYFVYLKSPVDDLRP